MTPVPTLYDRIEAKLGIEPIRSDRDLVRLVEGHLPTDVIAALLRQGLTDGEVHALIIPRRTLTHRKHRREPLSREESDRAVRVARLTALAETVFGDRDRAFRWLRAPKRRFDGKAPLALLVTETGARLIEEMLYQIDDGIFA